jgi:hypothetical protein
LLTGPAGEASGYVLDGFPRTVEQAKASFPTAHALGVEARVAVHLDVPPASGPAGQSNSEPVSRPCLTPGGSPHGPSCRV